MAFITAPGYQSVYNPPVPYTTLISGGLRPGMFVVIQATLPHDFNRWSINFTKAEGDDSDICLHMNARYDGRDRVIFNTRNNGEWQTEEIKKDMPFKSGKVFNVTFQITQNNFLIGANGDRFYEFGHRCPPDQVNWLNMAGDIVVQQVAILGNGASAKGNLVMSPMQSGLIPMMGPPAILPTLPFRACINGGMVLNRTVVVKGIPTGKNFVINLKPGFNSDIAFHFNLRLNKDAVIRNSLINGTWGQEEKEIARNPFKQGDNFEISIRSAENKFKVFINGSHSFDYPYRMYNLPQVDHVEVNGDVKVLYVFF